jgi:hypothetical protein
MTQIQNTSRSIAATKYFRIEAREHTLAPPGRHRQRHSQIGVGAEALSDDVVGTVDEANRKMITDACEYWIEQGKLGPPPPPTSEVLPSPRAVTDDYFDTESGREARVLERQNSLCLVELDGDANDEGAALPNHGQERYSAKDLGETYLTLEAAA